MDEVNKTDSKRVDTPMTPVKTKFVWDWECPSGHTSETPPSRVPDKCDGQIPTPWGAQPCGNENFRKIGEGRRVVDTKP